MQNIKIGKRGVMSQKANKILKQKFLNAGITTCEVCGSTEWLTFAHREKRRNMNTIEELSDINNVLLLCIYHHQEIEFDKNKTEKLFNRLRHE
jgi:nitrate reductase NapAB chaperone NapD